MHDLLTEPAFWIAALFVGCTIYILILAHFAPTGYEDATGWHRGPTHDHPNRDSRL